MFNGEIFMDAAQESGEPTELYFNKVLQLFLGNALMLNLLIAIYGEVFSEVQEFSDRDWKCEMMDLCFEYQA